MPSNRKRTRRPSLAEPWRIEFMLTGQVLKADGRRSLNPLLWENGNGCFAEAANLRPAWEAAKAELLPAWIKEHPGTRPFAWWELDAPEPRDPGESETAYLLRHNLLTDVEKAAKAQSGDTVPKNCHNGGAGI